jgi:hypothetical protein
LTALIAVNTLAKKKPPSPAYQKQWSRLCEIARRRDAAEDLFGLEWLFALVLCALLFLMPAMLVREVSGRFGYLARKCAVEVWAILKPAMLLVVLSYGTALAIAPWIATLALVDLFTYLLGLLFLSRFYTGPVSVRRSLLLLGVNFLEFILSFAVLYAHYKVIVSSNGAVETGPGAVAFFSLVTASTVGYGDLVPHAGLGRALASIQICSGLIFLSVFISQAVGRVGVGDGKT